MTYRSDIDGLRAVAVLSVVAYHIVPRILPGGYIGVDVFFVISGYLITSILWRQLTNGEFSFGDFYAKRIRRLFPALFSVILVSAAFEFAFGLPQEIQDFGFSSISAVFYVSNHYFLSQSSYFAEGLKDNPLLHTWSLSVEEQFYLLFPALLFFLFHRARGKVTVITLCLLGVLLLISEILVHADKAAAFYLMPSRFWQFLAGALLALNPMKNVISRPGIDLIGWFGLGMLGYSFVYFSGITPFPGINALIPTIGTLFLLYAGQHDQLWITRALSVRPAQFLGQISYSLYLWHWPVIIFYKLELSSQPSSIERYMLVVVSLILAYLSWRFIEQPFRKIAIKGNRHWIYAAGGVASIFLTLVGIYFVLTEGIKERYTEKQLSYIEYLSYDADPFFRTDRCFLTSESGSATLFDERECLKLDPHRPNVLIVGDSHAAQYHAAIELRFPGYSISQVNASGCRPLVNYEGEPRCTDLMETTFERYIKEYEFDAIILAGRWELKDLPALEQTTENLTLYSNKVIVLGPIIEYSQALPRLIVQKGDGESELVGAQLYRQIEKIDLRMKGMFGGKDVEYFSILDAMCPQKKCMVYTAEGVPMQFDASHLTKEGAVELISLLKDQGFLQKLISFANDN